MKIIKKIIGALLFVCLLYAVALAGAFALGYADGKENCPPPPCTEEPTKVNTYIPSGE